MLQLEDGEWVWFCGFEHKLRHVENERGMIVAAFYDYVCPKLVVEDVTGRRFEVYPHEVKKSENDPMYFRSKSISSNDEDKGHEGLRCPQISL